MLGGLAKWLRALGLDVAHDPGLDDPGVVERAENEGRWILTRDRSLVLRRRARHRHVLVESVEVPRQIHQVLGELGIEIGPDDLFSRCLRCNEALERVPAEEARDEVPPYVARTHDTFHRCPACRRLFWPATHVGRMRRKLEAWGVVGE